MIIYFQILYEWLIELFGKCPCCKKRGHTIDCGYYRYCIECGSHINLDGSYTNPRLEFFKELGKILAGYYAKTN